MPKVNIDYSNTIIYKITCKDNLCKELYVGHTTNFVQRKYAHKQSCKNDKSAIYTCKLYEAIRKHGGWDNWDMEVINFYNCKDHYEARKKENEYINLLNATLNSIQPLPKPKEPVIKIKKKIDNHCEVCNIKVANQQFLEVHNQTKKHNKNMTAIYTSKKTSKTSHLFICEKCDFKCSKKGDYNRHILTPKHLNTDISTAKYLHFLTPDVKKTSAVSSCSTFACECGKIYKHRQSLATHKKKCIREKKEETITECIVNDKQISALTNAVLVLAKENQEFKHMMVEQNNQNIELHKQMIEISKETKSMTINNTNNNQFNVNVFLNEKCKDALNITDFVNSLKLTLQDLEKTGEVGYVKGITNIILNGLNELDVYKRPIHCSDLKRETLYVKDNDIWEKENYDKKKIKNAIKYISSKNAKQVGAWTREKENKGYDDYSSKKNDKFMKIISEANGGEDEEINKIIKNISSNVTIDKQII